LSKDRTETTLKIRSFLDAIFDKNLYGKSFILGSLPYLSLGLFIQYTIYLALSSNLFAVYLPVYCILIIVSPILTKNIRVQFHPMEWRFAVLFLFASVFSKFSAFFFPFEATPIGAFMSLFVLLISELTFTISLVMIVVNGQRESLRENIGLTHSFFKNQKEMWSDEAKGFPNLEEIANNLDSGRFLTTFFDNGYFNLSILWSCNIMEQVVDATAETAISKAPEMKTLFRNREDRPVRYPKQLKNLGYKSILKGSGREFHVAILWHEVRRNIAHYNYMPSYYETMETLKILISFVEETPMILRKLGQLLTEE
jgi:hypothetical protein